MVEAVVEALLGSAQGRTADVADEHRVHGVLEAGVQEADRQVRRLGGWAGGRGLAVLRRRARRGGCARPGRRLAPAPGDDLGVELLHEVRPAVLLRRLHAPILHPCVPAVQHDRLAGALPDSA
jgi:hypothetical protein